MFDAFAHSLTESGKSPRTIRGYLSDLGTFQQWYRQTFNADPLTAQPMDLIEYRSWLQNVQRVSVATLNRHIAALRAFYSWAQENGLAAANAAAKLKMKTAQESTAPRSMTKEQFFRLVGAIKNVKNPARRARDMAAVYLMRYAGLRVSEACNLRWDDVDFTGNTLRVTAGKGDKFRVVPLNEKMKDVLQEWKQLRTGYQTADSPYVLISTRTAQLDATGLQKVVQKYLSSVGLDEFSCHSLRHTCAKSLIDAGVGIERVAAILGHESIETTKRYVRPTQADLHEAINRI
jgi:integrase/recombinase XerD